jgi:hypothetical protein
VNQPVQPSLGKATTKSPRKVSFLESGSPPASESPSRQSVDASTSIDLNLTRSSRIHRFIQTDMYSTEYGAIVNDMADLKTELEEKDKTIHSLKTEIQVEFLI